MTRELKAKLATELDSEAIINNKNLSKAELETLKPYAIYFSFLRKMKNNINLPYNDIKNFYNTYQNTPLKDLLNEKVLNILHKKQQWQNIINLYQTTNSKKLQCIHNEAIYKISADLKKHQLLINSLWLDDFWLPKECENLFKTWIQDELINNKLILKRLNLVKSTSRSKFKFKPSISLIKYLHGFLPRDSTEYKNNNLWLKVYQNPNLITTENLFKKNKLNNNNIIIMGIIKIAYLNPLQALKVYEKLKTQYQFNNTEIDKCLTEITIALYLKKYNTKAQKLYKKIGNINNYNLQILAIKYNLYKQNWSYLEQLINALPKDIKQEETWQYWLAKSLDKQNKKSKAKQIFSALAKHNTYYGILSQQYLNIKPVLINNINNQNKITIENNITIKRALLLYHNKQYYYAKLEWNYAVKQLNTIEEIYAAAMLAKKHQWFDRIIVTLSLDENLKKNPERFPTAYNNIISSIIKSYNNIDPALIFAITRKESIFMPYVTSSSGAIGLMQLMPKTAAWMAKKVKINAYHKKKLTDPKINMLLGIAYLQRLLDKYDNNKILAISAYNAGPSNVNKWIRKYKNTDIDIWIELIPFGETKDYIKNVLAYFVLYKIKISKYHKIFS